MSNDTADCGCEGHLENFEGCKYPALIAEVERLKAALMRVYRVLGPSVPKCLDVHCEGGCSAEWHEALRILKEVCGEYPSRKKEPK